jgi:hypothetical protein
MTSNKRLLRDLKPTYVRIQGISGQTVATFEGTCVGEGMDINGNWVPIQLQRVLYCADLPVGVNLISMRQVRSSGAAIKIGSKREKQASFIQRQNTHKYALLEEPNGLLCVHIHVDGITSVYDRATAAAYAANSQPPVQKHLDINLFHKLYGHVSERYLRLLASRSKVVLTGKLQQCHVCSRVKLKRHTIGTKTSTRSKVYLERVFTDLAGPIQPSVGGAKYMQLFVDDFSRKQWVYFLKDKTKESVHAATSQFLVDHPGVSIIRSDNGTEFTNKLFTSLLLNHKVQHEFTPDYSPEYNGVVERRIANLRLIATSLLGTANLFGHHRRLWAEAMSYAVSLSNDWPCSANPECKSANAMLPDHICSKPPTYIWGSICYLVKRSTLKANLDEHGEKGIFLGFALHDPDVARIYKFSTHSVVTTPDFVVHNGVHVRDDTILNWDIADLFVNLDAATVDVDTTDYVTTFADAVSPACTLNPAAAVVPDPVVSPQISLMAPSTNPITQGYSNPSWHVDSVPGPLSSAVNTDFPATSTRSGLRYGVGGAVRPMDLDNDVVFDDINQAPHDLSTMSDGVALAAILTAALPSDIPFDVGLAFVSTASNFSKLRTPRNYREAVTGPQAAEWIQAMEEEFNSLVTHGTWELVQCPDQKVNVVGSRWVFLIKFDQFGNVKRYKARFVAQGFSQQYQVDYFDTYAPVVGMTTIRLLLALACSYGWPVYQLDVETAFLNAPVSETIYLRQAPGMEVGKNMVYKLRKSLYGLKQSPYNWNAAVHEWFLSFGFKANSSDGCLYSMTDSVSGKRIFLTLYVDDIIVSGDWDCQILLFKTQLKQRFRIKDLGYIEHCLGLHITYDRVHRIMQVTQSHYIDQLLVRFNMENVAPISTPAEKYISKLDFEWHAQQGLDMGETAPVTFPFRELVGCLLYVAISTRPDIANAVRELSKYCNHPTELHVAIAKRVLRYLKSTRDLSLTYTGNTDRTLTGYVDAAYADNVDTARSTTGYLFMLCGGAIDWKSTCQHTVARSSCEAEYMALSDATTEALYLRNIMHDFFPLQDRASTTIFSDNQSALKIGKSTAPTRLSKHINVRYHNVREQVAAQHINIEYISTNKQPADMLTKNLGRVKLEGFRQQALGYLRA